MARRKAGANPDQDDIVRQLQGQGIGAASTLREDARELLLLARDLEEKARAATQARRPDLAAILTRKANETRDRAMMMAKLHHKRV